MGALVADINIGDCLGLLCIAGDLRVSIQRAALLLSPAAHRQRVQQEATRGTCSSRKASSAMSSRATSTSSTRGPVRDLLVDNFAQTQRGVDSATLHRLSNSLGRVLWRDLEIHHPVGSLFPPGEIAAAWEQRINTKGPQGQGRRGPTQPGVDARTPLTRRSRSDYLIYISSSDIRVKSVHQTKGSACRTLTTTPS